MSDETKTEKKKFELTDAHRAQFKPWADKWIANAMSTTPMTADDKLDCIKHVKKLYSVAKLDEPKHILFVSSPFALVIAGGLAAAICELGDKATITVPDMVKRLNSGEFTLKSMSSDKWYQSPYKAREIADKLGLGDFGVECIKNVHNMWNGGNQWSGWVSYLSFFRYIAKLDIDFSNWDCYEKLAELSGPRVVHRDFCILCDKPTILTVDEQNRPHGEKKPFCKWSDGGAFYSIHNVRVPAHVVLEPEKLTVDQIEKESNLEVRRVMINLYGQERFILDSKSEIVHTDDFGTLYKKELPGDEPLMLVKVTNSTAEADGTYKDYFIRVSPTAYGGLKTAHAAVASTWRNADGSMLFEKPEDYVCEVET